MPGGASRRVRTFAMQAGISKSAAGRDLAALTEAGLVRRKRRPGGVYVYQIARRFLPRWAKEQVSQAWDRQREARRARRAERVARGVPEPGTEEKPDKKNQGNARARAGFGKLRSELRRAAGPRPTAGRRGSAAGSGAAASSGSPIGDRAPMSRGALYRRICWAHRKARDARRRRKAGKYRKRRNGHPAATGSPLTPCIRADERRRSRSFPSQRAVLCQQNDAQPVGNDALQPG